MTFALLLAATHALAAAAPDPSIGLALAAERVPLSARVGDVAVTLDAMGARLTLVPQHDVEALRAQVRAAHGKLCPDVSVRHGAVVLGCRSRRLQVRIVDGPPRVLEIRQIAGLPWGTGLDGPPTPTHAPEELGLGGSCPGTTPGGRAECALLAGRTEPARQELLAEAVSGGGHAELRLGDLALAAGTPDAAAGHWKRAAASDAFGRLARARLCELDGGCLERPEETAVFDSAGLPHVLAEELELRWARALVFTGRLAEAVVHLRSGRGRDACRSEGVLCRRMLLEALRSTKARDPALVLYLDLPDREHGPLASELAMAAAEGAAEAGAPLFAAKLLAASAPAASQDSLGEHLGRAAELFLEGGDQVRARVILEYARSRLGDAATRGRWAAYLRAARGAPMPPPRSLPAPRPGVEAELASADEVVKAVRKGEVP